MLEVDLWPADHAESFHFLHKVIKLISLFYLFETIHILSVCTVSLAAMSRRLLSSVSNWIEGEATKGHAKSFWRNFLLLIKKTVQLTSSRPAPFPAIKTDTVSIFPSSQWGKESGLLWKMSAWRCNLAKGVPMMLNEETFYFSQKNLKLSGVRRQRSRLEVQRLKVRGHKGRKRWNSWRCCKFPLRTEDFKISWHHLLEPSNAACFSFFFFYRRYNQASKSHSDVALLGSGPYSGED